MANSNGWGDGSVNNSIGWGQGANNSIGWGKSQLISASGLTDIDGGNTPSNSVAPAITGTAQEGQTLTCSTGTWSGSPIYTYQWYRGVSAIGSATSSNYTLVTADIGQNIKCIVTATNFVGSATADSNTIVPIASGDADALAFISAAGITDATQKTAINNLVVSLKGYGIWSKFQALYPMVGGVSTAHAVNLKTPGTFNLTFSGGWTHSSTGAKPNGINGYADTGYNVNTNASLNSHSLSYYSRTDSNGNEVEIGVNGNNSDYDFIETRVSGSSYFFVNQSGVTSSLNSNAKGFYLANRTASNDIDGWKDGTKVVNGTTISTSKANRNLYIGALSHFSSTQLYSTKECAFSSIGQGLSDTEAANLYTAVQAFQTALGRSIGTQTVSDADAQAFVTAANIVDQVEATAVNNLVIGLKADGLWTKMKAVYPFVGGTATSHKWNLKDPRDLDAAFRLVFSGGVTHASTGIKGNGTNGYFQTYLNPSTVFSPSTGGSQFVYIRNNTDTNTDLGAFQSGVNYRFQLLSRSGNTFYGAALSNGIDTRSNTDSRGFFGVTRPPSSSTYNTIINTNSYTITDVYQEPNSTVTGFALNIDNGTIQYYGDHEFGFTCIADGLTTIESQNLRTAVITFNTTLSRNV